MASKIKKDAVSVPSLSKREYYAAFALAGLLARGTVDPEAAKLAVAAADLLVDALDGRRGSVKS